MTARDQWSRWLLETRFGGDAEAAARGMRHLVRVRDRVLDGARLSEGETLLDAGCGDGLIAFGALDKVGPSGRVIFSDISAPLLEHCERLADDAGARDRCSFLEASADDLSAVADASVDVVTTRSVLIYIQDKTAAFSEFHRVLKPGGRISLFEPINRFNETYAPGQWWGAGVAGLEDLTERLTGFYRELQPLDSDPMMDFDERDLLRLAEAAGFHWVDVAFHMYVTVSTPARWDAMIDSPGNPNIPSIRNQMQQIFTTDEATRFEAGVRPLVEAGGRAQRSAVAYVRARKDGGATREDEEA